MEVQISRVEDKQMKKALQDNMIRFTVKDSGLKYLQQEAGKVVERAVEAEWSRKHNIFIHQKCKICGITCDEPFYFHVNIDCQKGPEFEEMNVLKESIQMHTRREFRNNLEAKHRRDKLQNMLHDLDVFSPVCQTCFFHRKFFN